MITVDNKNFPEGFVIRTGASEGGVVEINAGEESQGMYILGDSSSSGGKAQVVKNGDELKVNDPKSGGWYGE